MTAPVDVLAVMELAYRNLNGGGDALTTREFVNAHAGMKEARAAFVELVEAARCAIHNTPETTPELVRLGTALVRVGGAK